METLLKCPLCGSKEFREFYSGIDLYFSKQHISYDGCEQCSLIFLNPRPSAQEYKEMYETTFQDKRRGIDTVEQAIDRLQKKGSYQEKKKEVEYIKEYLKKGDAFLEIGGGWGTFAKVIEDTLDVKGDVVEPSLLASRVAKEYYGLSVFQGSFQEFMEQGNTKKYNMVMLFHVFEHLTEPDKFLVQVKNMLLPGGILFLGLPDVSRPPEPSEKYFHIEHCFYYSPQTIQSTLQRYGFRTIKIIQDEQDMKVICTPDESISTGIAPLNELNIIRASIKKIDRKYSFLRGIKSFIFFFLNKNIRNKLSKTMSFLLRKLKIIKV